jgi:GT2 family glycosyltransferase
MTTGKGNGPLVWAAVLHYGATRDGRALNLLRATLDSLLAMNYPNFRIVVVDNGSTDGSIAAARDAYPSVAFVENDRNLGVTEGYNAGLRYGLEHGAGWVLLLNNDIVVDPAMLMELVNAGESDPKAGLLAPAMYYHDRPDRFWYAGGKVNYFTGIISHRGIRQADRGQYTATEETGYVNGCAMLIRRDAAEKIGLLDPIFSPGYSEDVDYSIRAARAGYRLLFVPSAKLWHKVSASSGGGMTPQKTRLRVEHNFLVLKRYASWYHWLTIPWCIGFMTLVFIIAQLMKGNFGIIGAMWKGMKGAMGMRAES